MNIWTDETVKNLRKWWGIDGLSASEISKKIPGSTRNAVIGKIHRLKLQRNLASPSIRKVFKIAPMPDGSIMWGPAQVAARVGVSGKTATRWMQRSARSTYNGTKWVIDGREVDAFWAETQILRDHSKIDRTKDAKAKNEKNRTATASANSARIDASPGMRLESLTANQCRWPVAEDAGGYFFCEEKSEDGRPYCAHHCTMAYVPRVGRQRGPNIYDPTVLKTYSKAGQGAPLFMGRGS